MDNKKIKQEYENFLEQDKDEPFIDREYVEHTKTLYEALLKDVHEDSFDKAVFDFVQLMIEVLKDSN